MLKRAKMFFLIKRSIPLLRLARHRRHLRRLAFMATAVQVRVADVMLWLVGGLVVGLDEVLGTGLEGDGFWARSLHGSLYLFAENIFIRHTF
jgi:hypothetical protein